jgi:spore coat protein U-like protein
MTGTTVSDTVNYSIYKDAAHSIVWGNTIGTNTLPGTGTGASQSIPVYGLVSAQASVPDSYADVVNVTITY